MILKSEFAIVDIGVDYTANGPRLKITDLQTGSFICLDPLELEALAQAKHKDFSSFVDPSERMPVGEHTEFPDEHELVVNGKYREEAST